MNRPISLRRNIGYAVASNSAALVVSLASVLLLPKVLSIADYGYWQLYLLLAGFVGLANLGLNDGVFLRYGGTSFDDLNRPVIAGVFWLVLSSTVAIGAVGVAMAYAYGGPYTWVLVCVSLAVPVTNARSLLLFVLQATNRIGSYALGSVVDRVLFSLGLLSLLLFPGLGVGWLFSADLVARAVSVGLACLLCISILVAWPGPLSEVLREAGRSIRAGSKLLIAGVASQGILGVIRISVERRWGIEAFGNVALVLSAVHFFSAFITAVALALFPWLRTLERSRLPQIYLPFRDVLTAAGFGLMLLYAPLILAFEAWFPQYGDAGRFMVALFPLVIYEAKISLVMTTYLNVVRRERELLIVNLIAFGVSCVVAIAVFTVFDDIYFAVTAMLLVQMMRSAMGEFAVSRALGVSTTNSMCLEVLLALTFLWAMGQGILVGSGIYAAALGIFLIARRRAFRRALDWVGSALSARKSNRKG